MGLIVSGMVLFAVLALVLLTSRRPPTVAGVEDHDHPVHLDISSTDLIRWASWQPSYGGPAVVTARLPDVEEVVTPVTALPEVFFKPGEPTRLEEYHGQEHVVQFLLAAIRGLAQDELALDPQMLLGYAGAGKTLLAKCIANELRVRAASLGLPVQPDFIEAFPADLPDVASLDKLMRRVMARPGSVLFIDEIHDLEGPHTRKLYLVLEEGRYQFQAESHPTKLPPTTLVAATTDYGRMHAALKRRWHKHFFMPASVEQLVTMVRRRPFPIAEDLARRIVERTKYSGAPWEALELYREAVVYAKGRGATRVEASDLDSVFGRNQLDDLGLRWIDRRVITALAGSPKYRENKKEGTRTLVCYAASENDVCLVSGVDKEEVREVIRPKLMARGLLQVKPGYGLALTDAAVSKYVEGVRT